MIDLFQGLMAILLILTSAFMILLILVQRGRGGGLSGALGGAGGQSAFGSKAGDVFTRITIGTAVVWILLAMLTISVFNKPPAPIAKELPEAGFRSTGDKKTEGGDNGAPGGADAQPGVSELEGGQLPGEESSSGASELPGAGAAQPVDPNLNPPKQEPPANPPGGEAPADGGDRQPGSSPGGGQ